MSSGYPSILAQTKNFLKQKKLSFGLIGLQILMLTALTVSHPAVRKISPVALRTSGQNISKDLSGLANITALTSTSTYQGLPVSGVEYHPVDGAVGTAILIPQYHLDPSTQPQDPSNDSAVRDQDQTAELLKYLSSKGVNMVMVEGDMNGDVSQGKIDNINKEAQLRDELQKQSTDLASAMQQAGWNRSNIAQVQSILNSQVSAATRDVTLKGAPYVALSQGTPLTLVGAEDQGTLDKAANVVRQYVYLNDRISAVKSPSLAAAGTGQTAQASAAGSKGGLSAILSSQGLNGQMLQQLLASFKRNPQQELSMAQSAASRQGNSALAQDISDAQSTMQQLAQDMKPAAASSTAPSRSDNPYSNITDVTTLKQLLSQTEDKINSIVIGDRNQNAAAYFTAALNRHDQKVGIIQFGAGHEDGLISDLNKQKLNVIVVTTNEVAARASAGV